MSVSTERSHPSNKAEGEAGSVVDRGPRPAPLRANGGSRERGSANSSRTFLYALIAIAGGSVGGESVIPFFGSLIGGFLAAFVVGMSCRHRPLMETGIAGGVIGGVVAVLGARDVDAVLGNLTCAVLGLGVPLVVVGSGLCAAFGMVKAYFGSDATFVKG